MKKIRLTESELVELIQRIIKEDETSTPSIGVKGCSTTLMKEYQKIGYKIKPTTRIKTWVNDEDDNKIITGGQIIQMREGGNLNAQDENTDYGHVVVKCSGGKTTSEEVAWE